MRLFPRSKVAVLLADPHALSRESTAAVLGAERDIDVVGEVGNGLEAVATAERVRPHIAVLHGPLASTETLQTTYLIHDRVPDCRIVVVTDVGDADRAVEALEAGASGLVTSGSSLSDLIDAIRAVARGEAVLPGECVSGVLQRLIRVSVAGDEARRLLHRLTVREQQVLTLFTQGESSESIAARLMIEPEEARGHVRDLLGKLGVLARLHGVKRDTVARSLFRRHPVDV
jgi:DNA-binding NarL/FixJ family response regulator